MCGCTEREGSCPVLLFSREKHWRWQDLVPLSAWTDELNPVKQLLGMVGSKAFPCLEVNVIGIMAINMLQIQQNSKSNFAGTNAGHSQVDMSVCPSCAEHQEHCKPCLGEGNSRLRSQWGLIQFFRGLILISAFQVFHFGHSWAKQEHRGSAGSCPLPSKASRWETTESKPRATRENKGPCGKGRNSKFWCSHEFVGVFLCDWLIDLFIYLLLSDCSSGTSMSQTFSVTKGSGCFSSG